MTKKRKQMYVPLYWNSKGTYQAAYNDLYARLVPAKGDAPTEDGQLLRYVSNIYYDVYNNGGCNLDMPFFREAGDFLCLRQEKLAPFADMLGVRRFPSGLRAFSRGNANGLMNDTIIDVAVLYIGCNQAGSDWARMCVRNRPMLVEYDRLRGTNLQRIGTPLELLVHTRSGQFDQEVREFLAFCADLHTRMTNGEDR